MNCKDVCGDEESVWFLLSDREKEGRRFLQWAKELGKEIDPRKGTDFFMLCIDSNGRLSNVPAMARVAKELRGVKRVRFCDVEHRK